MSNSLETKFFLILDNIKKRNYQQALQLVDEQLQKDDNSFDAWSFWLLGGICFAYNDKISSFYHYISKAKELNANYFGFHYLIAYHDLLEDNPKNALGGWLKVLDYKFSKPNEIEYKNLAKDLIEKTRLDYPLVLEAKEKKFDTFFSLAFLESIFIRVKSKKKNKQRIKIEEDFNQEDDKAQQELQSLYKLNNIKLSILQKIKSKLDFQSKKLKFQNKKKIRIKSLHLDIFKNHRRLIIIFLFLLFLFSSSFLIFLSYFDKKIVPIWENFSIDSYANVLPIQKTKLKFYKKKYKRRKQLIQDFNYAKLFLYKKKYNKARYLLQKIVHSNADFKSKEKAKIFLNFIPDSEHESFNDNLKVAQILKKPVLRKNSFILWEGKILKLKSTNKGQLIRILVRQEEKDYIVEGYILHENNNNSIINSIDNKKKLEKLIKSNKRAVIFGQYKSLIGTPKTIYIEIKKLWL